MANRPVMEFPASRHSKVAVWDNGEKGFSIKISPPSYKTAEGVWSETGFWTTDLPAIKQAIDHAIAWCERERQRRNSKGEAPPQEGPLSF